jgi:hypothetical protein
MTVQFQVVFDCAGPDALARFWAEVLGYKLQDPPPGFATWEEWATANEIPEDRWDAMSAIVDPEGAGARIFFQRVPEPKVVKNRVHLDVNVGGGLQVPLDDRRKRIDQEAARLIGARGDPPSGGGGGGRVFRQHARPGEERVRPAVARSRLGRARGSYQNRESHWLATALSACSTPRGAPGES